MESEGRLLTAWRRAMGQRPILRTGYAFANQRRIILKSDCDKMSAGVRFLYGAFN